MSDVTASTANPVAVIGVPFQVAVPGLPPPGRRQAIPSNDHRFDIQLLLAQLQQLSLRFGTPFRHWDVWWIKIILTHRRSTSCQPRCVPHTGLLFILVLPVHGVSVPFVRKRTISSARNIHGFAFCEVRFLKRINGLLRLVCVPDGGIRPPARTGRGREGQAVAVPGHGNLQHATTVDPLNVHRRHVAQQIHFDTPRPSVMPRLQGRLDVCSGSSTP